MSKVKDTEELLKTAKDSSNLQGSSQRVSDDLSTEILQARRDYNKIVTGMKSKDLQSRLLYPVRISLKIEEEIKSYPRPKKKNLNKKVHYHQNSITRNGKGFSLIRRKKEENKYNK